MKTRLLFSVLLFNSFLTFSQQWMYSDLTEPKLRLSAASLGTKAYFAGGDNTDVTLNLVEIWDVTNATWSYDYLSQARTFPEAVSCGSKIIFAGGLNFIPLSTSDVVDIYDTVTHAWTVGNLSEPRFLLSAVAHPQSHKVIFAGGLNLITNIASNAVDIYDVETGDWITDTLSMGRFAMGAAVVGDIAIFAGGDNLSSYTDRVDIYNFNTNTWTTDTLSQSRGYLAGAAVGSKVLIAGGMLDRYDPYAASNNMDIYDVSTGTWTLGIFPNARGFLNDASTIGEKVYFAGGGNFYGAGSSWMTSVNNIDIYDNATGEWSFNNLSHDLINHSVTSVETQEACYLLVAGGGSVQSDEIYSTVEILWDLVGVGESSVISRQSSVSCFPNPTQGIVDFRFPIFDGRWVSLKVYNAQGQEVAVVLDQEMQAGEHTVTWNTGNLPQGVYFYRLAILQASPSGQAADRGLMTSSGKIVKY